MKFKSNWDDVPIKKWLMTAKLMIYLMLIMVVQANASNAAAQKVNFSAQKVEFKEILTVIENQTGYMFFYDETLLDNANPVSVSFSDKSINEVMNDICASQNFTWSVEKKTITLVEKPNPQPASVEKPVKADAPLPAVVNGKVSGKNGESLPGATILIKGTSAGTSANLNGEFYINAKPEDILVVSFVGFKTIEVPVGNLITFNIILEPNLQDIDEVQIIAYGTTTKRLNTGSISSIKSKQIETRPVSNIIQALQGQVAGISVTNFSPGVGSAQQILVRGVNSITSGTNPLIIIDGVIINDSPGGLITDTYSGNTEGGGANTYQQGNSPLNQINPNDIESIDILKDADATAIYGSRGTNGVVLITTKGARLGETKVDINAFTGFQKASGVTKRLNTEQYLKLRKDAFAVGNITDGSVINPITPDNYNAPDLTLWSQSAYTDYPDLELNNTAPVYNFDATVTGGTKSLNFLSAASYRKIFDTYMFDPYQERYNGRIQINHTSKNEKWKLHLSTIFGRENQKFTTTNFSNVLGQANVNAPNFELHKADGSLNFGSGKGYIRGMYYNPLANKTLENKSVTDNFSFTGDITYTLLKGLDAKVQATLGQQFNNYKSIYPSTAINVQNPYDQLAKGSFTTNKFTSLNIEPFLTYVTQISKLNITALAGATFLDKKTARTGITVTDPGSDDLLYSYSSGNPTTAASGNSNYRFLSLYGRASLNWDQKYIANFTFRRDGSSRFGPANKYANFGSVGIGWIFSQDQYIKEHLSFLSFGKLRGSFGITGNNNIGDYLYLSLLEAPSYSSDSYNGNAWLHPTNYANPNIKWESTDKFDVGLELGFFKNRVHVNATWYRSLTTDLLLNLPLPSQTGYTGYTGNFPGVVQNSGLELELTTSNLSPGSSVQWTTKFNITQNANILKKFPGLAESAYANKLVIGRALPSSDYLQSTLEFPYYFTGIDTQTGLPKFKDINGDGVINYNDYYNNPAAYYGSATPTLWGGVTNTVSYKGFSLDVFAQFSNGIFTNWNFYGSSVGSIFNPSVDVIDNYWMKPGDNKKYPRLYTGVAGNGKYLNPITQQLPYSTFGLYKGYYIRLKNVQLSYTLPEKLASKLKLDNVLIYVSGENLAVYTPVKLHKDPEIFWSRSAGVLKTLTTGIRVTF